VPAPSDEAKGRGPFRFTPVRGPSIEGHAFSATFRVATTLMVLGVGFWLALVWLGERAKGNGTGGGLLAWFFAAFVMLVFFWWWILRSRTRIDEQGLHQSWYTDKHVAIADLAAVGVVRLRGLEWLVAPRVHARTLMGKFTVFHAADPALLDEFARLSRELQAFRQR
jgi:hypothetical protein